MEEALAASIVGWDACEVFGDHLREFVEFLDYQGFHDDLFSTNGSNTGGIRLCHGRAIWLEDPETRAGNVDGDVDFGFGIASLEGDLYAPEEYQTPTGRYDRFLQIRRELYDPETLAERLEEGPWDEATVLLGDTGIGTTLSAFVVDVERDFMLELSVGLDSASGRADHADELTWTLEEAAQHFREVTLPNAYQEMADRIDEAS